MIAQVVFHYLDAKMDTVLTHLNAGAMKDGLELIVIKVPKQFFAMHLNAELD